ncbi:MAG: CHASE3 domain-containing protein [Steroidobacteraceae bacterium]
MSVTTPLGVLTLLPRAIWVPLALMGCLIGGLFWTNEKAVKAVHEQGDHIASLLSFQSRVLEFRNTVVDAETGQRGYLLTNNPEYLQPYRDSVEKLVSILPAFRRAAAATPETTQLVASMEILQSKKLAELAATISMNSNGDRPQALAIVRNSYGQQVMTDFRDAADSILRRIADLVDAARRSQAQNLIRSRDIGVIMTILSLAMLLLVLQLFIRQARRQALAQINAEQHQADLQYLVDDRSRELFELSTYLQSVQEREKATLARNLHDELGGVLTAAKMDLAWLQSRSERASPDMKGKLREIGFFLESAMDLKRRVIEDLRPSLLDHFGLVSALGAYYDETCRRAGLKYRATLDDAIGEVPSDIALGIFRVAQEALTNVIRHANATTVYLELTSDRHHYRLTVRDDGVGLDNMRDVGSHGLAGMRHRVVALHGHVNIDGTAGRGTTIRANFPRVLGATQ